MHARGLKQTDLARKIGSSQGHISHLLSGRTTPDLSTIEKLATALDAEPSDLLKKIPK